MALDLDADFLQRRPANFRPMSPINFLFRSADVFPDRVAIIHGDQRFTWREHAARCRLLASALRKVGVGRGDIVSVVSPNTPAMLEAHFGVPMSGGILNTLNTRLDPAAIAFILEHSETKVSSSTSSGAVSLGTRCRSSPNAPSSSISKTSTPKVESGSATTVTRTSCGRESRTTRSSGRTTSSTRFR